MAEAGKPAGQSEGPLVGLDVSDQREGLLPRIGIEVATSEKW